MKRALFQIVLFIVLAAHVGWGQIPQTISYQGVLTDANGVLLPDGSYNLAFSLYNVPISGNPLWAESQTVQVTAGVFNVILGSVAPLTLPFDQRYWLGVRIGTGTEFAPRTQLTAAPYSLNARSIVDSTVTNSKIASNAVTSTKIADGAVTSAKVADNSLINIDISANAAIAISKISGDAGIAFNNLSNAGFDIPTTVTNLGSVSINAPTAGFVLLLLSGDAVFFGDQTVVDVGLSTSPSSINLHSTRVGRQDGSSDLRYIGAFTDMVVAPVSAGTNTFFAVAQKESVFSAAQVNLGDLYLVALFFPKRYQSVVSSDAKE